MTTHASPLVTEVLAGAEWIKVRVCCWEMQTALTIAETGRTAIRIDEDGYVLASALHLPPVEFCPWCGRALVVEEVARCPAISG